MKFMDNIYLHVLLKKTKTTTKTSKCDINKRAVTYSDQKCWAGQDYTTDAMTSRCVELECVSRKQTQAILFNGDSR